MSYKLKAITAEGFQFNDESEVTGPRWFGKAVLREDVHIDRAIRDGAVTVRGCSVKFGGGWIHAKVGDYIVRLKTGEIFVVSKKKFNKYFEQTT